MNELDGEGTDKVYSSIDWSISGSLAENLVLIGDKAKFAGGNDLANSIVGNDVDNIIAGQGGGDLVDGAGGNDSIFSGSGNDTIDGGDGVDIVRFDTSSSAGLNLTVGEAGEYFTGRFFRHRTRRRQAQECRRLRSALSAPTR